MTTPAQRPLLSNATNALECLEYSYSFLQEECAARRATCADCGSVWGCLPKVSVSNHARARQSEFKCPVRCTPGSSSSCSLMMVTDPSKPIFPTDTRCIFRTGGVTCTPNCKMYGPIDCPDAATCGKPVMEGNFVSPYYYGWWECGPSCITQIRSLGICTVSDFNAEDWGIGANATSSATVKTSATIAPVTSTVPAATQTSSKSSAVSTTVMVTSTAEAIATPPPATSGPNVGAIVGIVVGIVAVVALAIGLFLFRRSRKSSKGDGNDGGEEAQPLKRGLSRDMAELTDSGHMDLGPALGIGAAAAGAVGVTADGVARPPSIWDPTYVPSANARKPTIRAIIPQGALDGAPAMSSASPLQPQMAQRSASVPTIVSSDGDYILARPRPIATALASYPALSMPTPTQDSASMMYPASETGSMRGMNAYAASTSDKPAIMEAILADLNGPSSAPSSVHARQVDEEDDDDDAFIDKAMSKYSSLGEDSLAELHQYMIEESANRRQQQQQQQQAAVQQPMIARPEPVEHMVRPGDSDKPDNKLILPSLKSVRTSLHSFEIHPSTAPSDPSLPPQAATSLLPISNSGSTSSFNYTSPMSRLGIPPAANPSMLLPSFPSVRQQTMMAAKTVPMPQYRPKSYLSEAETEPDLGLERVLDYDDEDEENRMDNASNV